MFRNIYVQAYKNSLRNEGTLQTMLCHVHHIYSALGCVIQDIQFMVGGLLAQQKMKAQPSPSTINRKVNTIQQQIQKSKAKVPKLQELPSSLFKQDFGSFQNFKEPTKPKKRQSGRNERNEEKRHDNYDQIFSQNKRPSKQPKKSPIKMQESQEDFIDYLFGKKQKKNT